MGKKKKKRQPEPEQRQPRLNRRQLLGLAAAAALALCLLAWAATRPSAVMKKIDLLAREAQADWVDLELGMDPAGPAGYAVFFSVCSGESRASVYHSTGRTLAAAWDAAAVLILLFFATAVEHLGRGETAENRRHSRPCGRAAWPAMPPRACIRRIWRICRSTMACRWTRPATRCATPPLLKI